MMYRLHILLVWNLILSQIVIFPVSASKNLTHHGEIISRSKRFIYYTTEYRLALPTGSKGRIALTISFPIARNTPISLGSHGTIGTSFNINFDDLGSTSDENPWGFWPDLKFRMKRDAREQMDGVNWAGGDREMIFQVAEGYLTLHGMKGKPCLLRAICEVFETPLLNHGLFGEIIQLISSVSNSIGAAERLADYLEAEELGKKHKSCSKYYAGCSKSLLTHNAQKMKDPINIERTNNNEIRSRSKRLIYYTHEGRLSFPPGTILSVGLELTLPFLRDAPVGVSAETTIQIPVNIEFDDLGITSEENPWGLWPDFSDYGPFPKRRHGQEPMDGVNWAGGDREMVFQVIQDYLNFHGMIGKPCLLRAICELFETPLLKHGLFGEILHLIFSVSNSIGAAERLADYLEAEEIGRKRKSCTKYYAGCSMSLFTRKIHKMKDSSNIERTLHKFQKMSKEDPEQSCRAKMDKLNELMECGRVLNEL